MKEREEVKKTELSNERKTEMKNEFMKPNNYYRKKEKEKRRKKGKGSKDKQKWHNTNEWTPMLISVIRYILSNEYLSQYPPPQLNVDHKFKTT